MTRHHLYSYVSVGNRKRRRNHKRSIIKYITREKYSRNTSTPFEIFTLVLTIAIGYDLIKCFTKLISSDIIPVLPIIQISVVAVANKIITLDTKRTDPATLYGLATPLAGLGVAFYLFKETTTLKMRNSAGKPVFLFVDFVHFCRSKLKVRARLGVFNRNYFFTTKAGINAGFCRETKGDFILCCLFGHLCCHLIHL